MGSLGNPKPWVPYMNTKDCSQGFCSIYCPQWCYIIFPPPPPIEFPDENSGPNFSPLVIAIIGILTSAFLLVSYYAIISKYCGSMDRRRRRRDGQNPDEDFDDSDNNPSNHELWHVATTGLDEALIKSITVCKYKRGDGLIQGTDCSVCLGEFAEDESVRLLPKCSHAFHVNCIDTWLRSHSNCPLCRANVVSVNSPPPPPPLPPPIPEPPLSNEVSPPVEEVGEAEEGALQGIPKTPNEVGDSGDVVIDVRDYDDRPIRRSVSMDCYTQSRVSIADVLRVEQDEEIEIEEGECGGEMSKPGRTGHGSVAMKRSMSSGRFSVSRHGRERNVLMPL